jgi:hypothetical protein
VDGQVTDAKFSAAFDARHGHRRRGDPRRTPHTGDTRFDKTEVPDAVFGPHSADVWAVLDRISWFALADATKLARIGTRIRGSYVRWDHAGDGYQCVAAARATGGYRLADWRSIREIAHHIQLASAAGVPGLPRHLRRGHRGASMGSAQPVTTRSRGV